MMLVVAKYGWIGALFGLLSVAAGAFGAHWLKPRLDPSSLETFELAVRYQMYHALALMVIAATQRSAYFQTAGWLWVAGTVIFSGSLVILSLSDLRWMGAVTPLGGTALLLGWSFAIFGFWSSR